MSHDDYGEQKASHASVVLHELEFLVSLDDSLDAGQSQHLGQPKETQHLERAKVGISVVGVSSAFHGHCDIVHGNARDEVYAEPTA